MSFAMNRDCRIAFDVVGDGPAVVLQGGLTSRKFDVERLGYVDVFADRFQVVNVDSLGHGDSDKPLDPDRYVARQRAADLIAVLDEVGIEQAHLLGYSMGGWIAAAMIIHHPDRLASAIIGGWNPRPPEPVSDAELSFEELLALGRREIPEQLGWVTPMIEPALRCCYDALDEVQDIEPTLETFGKPVLLWNGTQDRACKPASQLAARHSNVQALETPGDHMSVWFNEDVTTRRALRAFVDGAEDAVRTR